MIGLPPPSTVLPLRERKGRQRNPRQTKENPREDVLVFCCVSLNERDPSDRREIQICSHADQDTRTPIHACRRRERFSLKPPVRRRSGQKQDACDPGERHLPMPSACTTMHRHIYMYIDIYTCTKISIFLIWESRNTLFTGDSGERNVQMVKSSSDEIETMLRLFSHAPKQRRSRDDSLFNRHFVHPRVVLGTDAEDPLL